MLQRRSIAAGLAAVALTACDSASSGPTPSDTGIVVITTGGTALSDGSDDVPPTLDLRITAARPLTTGEVSTQLDGTDLHLDADSSGALSASTRPMPLGSAHRLTLRLPARGERTLSFRVVPPSAALAALHSDPRDGTVLDLAFQYSPDHAAVDDAIIGGTPTWIDDSHLRVTWSRPPSGRFTLAASTPTERGSHLAGDLSLDLGAVPAGILRTAAIPPPPSLPGRPTVVAFSVATAASRASLAAHATQISVVSPTGLRAAGDGSLLGAVDASTIAIASAHGVPLWPLVQNDGFDAAMTSRLLHDTAASSQLIQSLTAVAGSPGFGGIDLDFEELDDSDRDALSAFIGDLAGALHAHGHRLAVCVVPRKPGSLNLHSDVYDLRRIAASADLVTVMAYEQHTPSTEPGPVAALGWVDTIAATATTGLRPERTLLGLATYARTWSSGGASADSYDAAVADALTTAGARVDADFADATLVIRGADGSLTYADSGATLLRRAAVAGAHRFAGIAMWRLGFEDPALWTLLPSAAPRP